MTKIHFHVQNTMLVRFNEAVTKIGIVTMYLCDIYRNISQKLLVITILTVYSLAKSKHNCFTLSTLPLKKTRLRQGDPRIKSHNPKPHIIWLIMNPNGSDNESLADDESQRL